MLSLCIHTLVTLLAMLTSSASSISLCPGPKQGCPTTVSRAHLHSTDTAVPSVACARAMAHLLSASIAPSALIRLATKRGCSRAQWCSPVISAVGRLRKRLLGV